MNMVHMHCIHYSITNLQQLIRHTTWDSVYDNLTSSVSHECKEIQLSKLLEVQLQKDSNVLRQIHFTVATRKNLLCQSSSLNDSLCQELSDVSF